MVVVEEVVFRTGLAQTCHVKHDPAKPASPDS